MRLVTTTDINIRSGPSMVFEVVDTVSKGTELFSFEYKKDSEKIGWYHVDQGWVCARYVSNSKEAIATNPDIARMNLRQNADEETPNKPKDVTTVSSEINKGAATRTADSNNVLRSILGVGGEAETAANSALMKKRAFGLPYQFMKSVDLRATSNSKMGLDYLYTMAEAPYISYVPGKPLFLPDLSNEERDQYFKIFNELGNPLGKDEAHLTGIWDKLDSGNTEIKYFGFEMDYINYISYVNTICWMFAIMLNIGDEIVPGTESMGLRSDGKPLNTFGRYNWAYYRLENLFLHQNNYGEESSIYFNGKSAGENASNTASGAWDRFMDGMNKDKGMWDSGVDALQYMLDKMDKEPFYTDFYINPNVSYSESFTNGTSPSMVEGLMNQASDYAKEIGFLLSAGVGADSRSQENLHKQIKSISGDVTGGNGIMSRLLSGVSTIISGANIAFPEIWKSSDFSRSYNVDITLKTPYGNKKAIFMDILVPMAHWIALAAPRMQSVNTYSAPFLVKFFIPGFCSVDMGVVENLTITKGGDGSAWSCDGLPLEVNLSVTIKDLYTQLSMHRINAVSSTDIYNFLWNTNFLDYLSVQSGLNMKQSEAGKKFAILKALTVDKLDARVATDAVRDQILETVFGQSSKWLQGVAPIMTR